MKIVIGLLTAALVGCAPLPDQYAAQGHDQARPQLADFESICRNTPFADYADCLEGNMSSTYSDWQSDAHADLVQVYLSWLHAAGSRVRGGTMDEDEARMQAAEMRFRVTQLASERTNTAQISQQSRDDAFFRMLVGIAAISAATQPNYVPPPSAPITCTQYRANRVTGQIQTVCH